MNNLPSYQVFPWIVLVRDFNEWGPFLDGRSHSTGWFRGSDQATGHWSRTYYRNGEVELTLDFD